jgi:hypothetical protein
MTDLRTAAQLAVTMLKTGMPEYDARDVLEVLEAALEQPERAQAMRDAGYTRRPTLREMAALEQALEALIAVTTRTCAGTDGMDITPINDAFDMADTAITALKAALEQPIEPEDNHD